METIQMDWLAVLVATLLNMIIGFLWYSKWLFGVQWFKMAHISEHSKKETKWGVFWGLITSLVTAFFLEFFILHLGVSTVVDGMFVGFCLWLGFLATTLFSLNMWEKKPFAYFLINGGCKLFSFLVMGGVLGS